MSLTKHIARVFQISLENGGLLQKIVYPTATVKRGRKIWHSGFAKEVYQRRVAAGPEPQQPRSSWRNWNYESELYAFGKRLGEDFQEATLKRAFTHRCYVEAEVKRQNELGVDGIGMDDNGSLVTAGTELSERYIKAYLRHSYPALPEEGIRAVCDWLMGDEVLVHVASNLGVRDLILHNEFPVPPTSLSTTLVAVVGALAHDQGSDCAHHFVQDFILTQLVGKNVTDIWDIVNPMGVLTDILTREGGDLPEPRLLWETGSETLVASYMVGIYSNKQLIGKGFGESVSIAEEMAARDALRQIFNTTLHATPLPLGDKGRLLDLDLDRKNASLANLSIIQ